MNSLIRRLIWVACAIVPAGIAGCQPVMSSTRTAESDGVRKFSGDYPIKVTCTTGQVAEMIRRIGGEYVAVEALMGPGVDPHLYSPVASDVRRLSGADAIFYNGLHLEGRMADLFVQMARSKATFAVTEGLQNRRDARLREPPEFAGLYDPHVWHDPVLWSSCVKDMTDSLAEFDPEHAAYYKSNAEQYRQELADLDAWCLKELDRIPLDRRVLVTAHDAFGYFGKRYKIEVFGLKGISTEDEKDLGRQDAIQAMLVKRRIPAVFVESAVAPKTIKALVEPCQAAGLDLQIGGELYADAMGPQGSGDETYAGMLRHNVSTIVDALTREVPDVNSKPRGG